MPYWISKTYKEMLHNTTCALLQVRWGGRSQDGAGNTVGEEVEQVCY